MERGGSELLTDGRGFRILGVACGRGGFVNSLARVIAIDCGQNKQPSASSGQIRCIEAERSIRCAIEGSNSEVSPDTVKCSSRPLQVCLCSSRD